MNNKITFITGINEVPQDSWNRLTAEHYPFLKHQFLSALEESGSACNESGWQPYHLILTCQSTQTVMAAMPLYIKTHSYGEYIFDWAWADAYQRYGQRYYPKLLSAIPFTPVSGPRLLIAPSAPIENIKTAAYRALQQEVHHLGLSSCHILYPQEPEQLLSQTGWLKRENVQFQWHNQDYASFDDFLARFTSRKRKNLRKERNRVYEQGVRVERYSADQIREQDLHIFYQCYQDTYLKRSGHRGYLNQECFLKWWHTMKENMMLVVAQKDNETIASALYFFNRTGLYGRYWGCLQDIDALHFEVCYYQGIEFCIEKKLPLFNPGTQGEHKIQRGFEPVTCHSMHWIEAPTFREAINHFTLQELRQMRQYKQRTTTLLPFKNTC